MLPPRRKKGGSHRWLLAAGCLFLFAVVYVQFARTLISSPLSPSTASSDTVAGDVDGLGAEPANFVLVRGFPKSGTSWLRMLLSLHPEVYMLPYEAQLQRVHEAVEQAMQPPWLCSRAPYSDVLASWAAELVPRVLRRAAADHPGATWVGEKSPAPIAPLVPGARYLWVVRDGRDVVVSLLWHHVRLGGFEGFCRARHLPPATDQNHRSDDGSSDALRFLADPSSEPVPLVDPDLVAEWRAWHRADHDHTAPPSVLRAELPTLERDPSSLLANVNCVRQLAASWVQHMSADGRLAADNPLVYTGRYERFVDNVADERAALYRWLGLLPELAQALGEYTYPLKGLAADHPFRPKDNLFFRKGEPGDWHRHFSKSASDAFRQAGGMKMLKYLNYV